MSDDIGLWRDNVRRAKNLFDSGDPNVSTSVKKYGISLYMDCVISRVLASQYTDFTDVERAKRKVELMELVRRIIDEVFEEEGK